MECWIHKDSETYGEEAQPWFLVLFVLCLVFLAMPS